MMTEALLFWLAAIAGFASGFFVRGIFESARTERAAYRMLVEQRKQEATAYLQLVERDRIKQAQEAARHEPIN